MGIVLLGLGLGLGSWSPAVGAASPSEAAEGASTSTRVPNLMVWVEPGVPEGDRVVGWVEERGVEVLREHQPSLEEEDLVRVAVRGGPYDYEIHVALVRKQRLLDEQLEVIVCECSSDEMLLRVGEAIGEGARRLSEAAEESKMPPPAPEPLRGSEREPGGEKKVRRLRAMGYAGIGVGVLGAGAMAGGIVLAVRPDEVRGEPGSTARYTTRPPGIGLAVGGAAALATGITLVVVDAVLHRKSRVAVVPAVGGGWAGVSIGGRF